MLRSIADNPKAYFILSELMHALELPSEALRNLYLSGADVQQAATAETGAQAASSASGDADDLFASLLGGGAEDSAQAGSTADAARVDTYEHWFADSAFKLWLNHLSEIPGRTRQHSMLKNIPQDILEIVVEELRNAAYRENALGLNLPAQMLQSLLSRTDSASKRDQMVMSQVLRVQMVLRDFIAWLGYLDMNEGAKPASASVANGKVFARTTALDSASGLPDLPEKNDMGKGREFLKDWVACLIDMIMKNAGFTAGQEISDDQNEALGVIIADIKRVDIWLYSFLSIRCPASAQVTLNSTSRVGTAARRTSSSASGAIRRRPTLMPWASGAVSSSGCDLETDRRARAGWSSRSARRSSTPCSRSGATHPSASRCASPGELRQYPVRPIPNDVTPSTAAGEAPVQATVVDIAPKSPEPVSPPAEEPLAPSVVKEEAVAPAEPQAPTMPKPKRMGAIIGGALALLVAAGVAAWFLMKKDETPQPPAKPAAPAAAPVPAAAACSKENLASAAEMAFVQDCVRDVKDSAAMLGIIQAAREAGKCSIAQRLYANRAQAGDVPIALAYAQEYDPAGYKENACFKADAATAAYWYQAVLDKDKDNAQALARLKDLPK